MEYFQVKQVLDSLAELICQIRHCSMALIFFSLTCIQNADGQPGSRQTQGSLHCYSIPFSLETMAPRGKGQDCKTVCDDLYKNLGDALETIGKENFIDISQSSRVVFLQNNGGNEFWTVPDLQPDLLKKIDEKCFCLFALYMTAFAGPINPFMPWLIHSNPDDIASRLSGSLTDGSVEWIVRPFPSVAIVSVPCDKILKHPIQQHILMSSPVRRIVTQLPTITERMAIHQNFNEIITMASNVDSIVNRDLLQSRIESHERNYLGVNLASALHQLLLEQSVDDDQLLVIDPEQQNDLFVLDSEVDFMGLGRLFSTAEFERQPNDVAESSSAGANRVRGLDLDAEAEHWNGFDGGGSLPKFDPEPGSTL